MSFYVQAAEHARDGEARARLAVLAARAALDSGHTDRGLALAADVPESAPLELRARAATIRADAERRLGRPDQARKELEPFLEAVDRLSADTASTLLRFCSRAHAELGDVAAGRPLAEQALLRAEESGDPALIGWALNDVSALYYFAGQRRLGVVILDGAISYCETHHAASPLLAVLVNRAVGSVAYDVREALRYYERALHGNRQASDSWGVLLTVVALHMVHTIGGQWDDDEAVADETAWLTEPLMDEIPLFRRLLEALHVLRAWLRGEEPAVAVGPLDEEALSRARKDMAQEVGLITLVRGRTSGGLADAAAELGRAAIKGLNFYGGTVEWYPFLWSCAVGWLIDSGAPEDLAAARQAIDVVEQARGVREPAVQAQLPRLRASLALADPTTPVDEAAVERDLREAITALEAYGAMPDRARAQLLLGRLLADSGQPAEAMTLLAEARSAFSTLHIPGAASDADAALAALPRTA
jgi:tetratricopeptide (TPR) repeat protein